MTQAGGNALCEIQLLPVWYGAILRQYARGFMQGFLHHGLDAEGVMQKAVVAIIIRCAGGEEKRDGKNDVAGAFQDGILMCRKSSRLMSIFIFPCSSTITRSVLKMVSMRCAIITRVTGRARTA